MYGKKDKKGKKARCGYKKIKKILWAKLRFFGLTKGFFKEIKEFQFCAK